MFLPNLSELPENSRGQLVAEGASPCTHRKHFEKNSKDAFGDVFDVSDCIHVGSLVLAFPSALSNYVPCKCHCELHY